ncbi:S-adenosyl-L-methionine-dependent methyltransferase [Geranomyces variabilis]|nr:S-adenosyl-L-methionine-dependent methyltransferase [Geranomyces variabilis]KAJ3136235.1 hypothetical protein HDU90_003285 [Geranomyces variabilis]
MPSPLQLPPGSGICRKVVAAAHRRCTGVPSRPSTPPPLRGPVRQLHTTSPVHALPERKLQDRPTSSPSSSSSSWSASPLPPPPLQFLSSTTTIPASHRSPLPPPPLRKKKLWKQSKKAAADKTPNDNIFPPDLPALLRSLNLPGPIPYLADRETLREMSSPYAYHQEVTVTIFATSDSGHGVAIGVDNWLVLVPTVLEGEVVCARVYRDGEGFSIAELVEVVTPNAMRVAPRCEYFGRCGGCGFQHVEYGEQLRRKREMVQRVYRPLLAAAAKGADAESSVEVSQVVPSPRQYGYRTKMTPHYEQRRAGMPLENIGYNERGRKTVLDVDRCAIVTDEINAAYSKARGRLLGATNPSNALGSTLMFRHGLALNGAPPRPRQSVDDPPQPWPPADATPTVVTAPRDFVTDSIDGLHLSYPAHTFFQTNSSILPTFLAHIRSQLATARRDHGISSLIDAYCGAGIFALACAPDFRRVVGIELDAKSLAAATANAHANGIRNAAFVTGSADAVFDTLASNGALPNADTTAVILDPPAKGAGAAFVDQLLRFNPKVVVYVSCNVASQVRDLNRLVLDDDEKDTSPAVVVHPDDGGPRVPPPRQLLIGGKMVDLQTLIATARANAKPKLYDVVSVTPFDMFPQTAQLETVTVLVRRD